MSRQPRTDPVPHLTAVAAALAPPGQPRPVFPVADRALAAVLGHKLFTLLLHHEDTGESERVYTNQPAAYPVGGRKPLNLTPPMQRLFRDHQPYLGRTAADIREVFFDHALIASLGCASVLNLPVVWDGHLLGTVNLLHEERWYDETDLPVGLPFAALLVPAYLALTRA
ncbi:MAG: GAF domain-containing protein [Candidatus Rokubacteria bacterium]|nr:GAF domain-containing protein [Candidatus Rokubacteria bacterium]MBI3826296.1 GAF domain-containing protein [Candidatus Rokubacteria bacterium]